MMISIKCYMMYLVVFKKVFFTFLSCEKFHLIVVTYSIIKLHPCFLYEHHETYNKFRGVYIIIFI